MKMTKRSYCRHSPALRLLSIIVAAVFLFTCNHTVVVGQNDKPAKIDELLTIANRYGQFNGAVLVAERGQVIYKKGIGLANMEWGIPNTSDTKFRLGSITKQFTAMLILQLVEQGKIKLDGKLSDYLPDYRKDTGQRITIHQLLTHTSGIPNYTSQPGFFETVSRNPYTVEDFIKKYASGDLEFEPGTKFTYDNSGYFLLGAIVEHVTGKSYEQVIRENILEPLGMKYTGYDHHDQVIVKRAAGYVRNSKGYVNAPYLDMSIPYAAGSLYSTVDDLYLWDQALYTEKLVSARSKEMMFKPFLENYAYGFIVTSAPFKVRNEAVPVITHGGGINGFNTTIVRFIADKNLIVMLDNTSQGRYLDRLSEAIGRILYDQPYELLKKSIAESISQTIESKGIESGLAEYRELKAKQSSMYDFGEGELNGLGYELLRARKVKEAIAVFKLNVEFYPQSANPYDSLGEAYMASGQQELAVENYRQALAINPRNSNAAATIKRLESKSTPVDPKTYDSYVGDYQVSENFIVKIFREGDHLMTQATGQPKAEIFPESADVFYLKVVDAKVSFVKGAGGEITGLVIHQGGREIQGQRIR